MAVAGSEQLAAPARPRSARTPFRLGLNSTERCADKCLASLLDSAGEAYAYASCFRLSGHRRSQSATGEKILPEARILAVADVVEAMASHRPYRPALGVATELEEVRPGAGSRYDAEAVAACERVFERGFVFTES